MLEVGAFKYLTILCRGSPWGGWFTSDTSLVRLRARSQGYSVLWRVTCYCCVHTLLLHYEVPIAPSREAINNMIFSCSEKPSAMVQKVQSAESLKRLILISEYSITMLFCEEASLQSGQYNMIVFLLLKQFMVQQTIVSPCNAQAFSYVLISRREWFTERDLLGQEQVCNRSLWK